MTIYVLVVTYDGDYDEPEVHGPFMSVQDAQAYAERLRVRRGLPGPATPENNDAWTEAGWYFGIKRPFTEEADQLPGGDAL